jgi:hypothetical protein
VYQGIKITEKEKIDRLYTGLYQLDEEGRAYIDNITVRLADIHTEKPASRLKDNIEKDEKKPSEPCMESRATAL